MIRATIAAATILAAGAAQGGELYAQGGIAWQAPHGACHTASGAVGWCMWDRIEYVPVLAHLEIGYTIERGRWSTDLYARHESLPTVNDFGVNQIGIAARVRLWGTP